MGFSKQLYSYYVNRGSYSLQGLNNVYKVDKSQPLPYNIITKGVVNFGRSHFNCNSMNGVPVEDGGGEGSAGSHWEKVALGNEMMVAN